DNRERLTQASADLERRRLQLEAVLANIGTGVIAVDSFGTITTLNRAAAKLLHIEPVQAQGHNYKDVLQGESAALIDVISQAYSASTNGNTALPEFGQWSVKADGNPKMLAAVATSLKESESQWGVVVVIDDMTHLIKGQREMAWREVARRIAHEIKNPLTPIKLSAQRLQRRLSDFRGSDGNLLRECTDTIIKHTDELKEMVNEFSNFARFPEVSPTPNDINVALNEVVHLYKPAHPEISFKISLETKMPVFEFDRDQIKRVIINLFNNAVAAVKSRHDYRTKEIKLLSHYNEQLEMAVIEVSDNGPGMSEDVMARVFEPYFSTKAEGTGLGLAITKRIINDHDGFIRVHSVLGQGTEFLIELPTNLRQGIERRRSRMGGATGVNLKE
ncbi:MAG: ATP-binding protein, partial [Bdellovibrionota bacterium]